MISKTRFFHQNFLILNGIILNLKTTDMKKQATAIWNGTGKAGTGYLSTENGVLNKTQYSFSSRFEGTTPGTSPEELIAAAHSGCFSMKLAFNLDEAGFPPNEIKTTCTVTIEEGKI